MTALETYREWVENKADRCNEPAIVIIWGKLFPPNALGPRCEAHAADYLPLSAMYAIDQWAVFDLRGLVRQEEVPA
jgi:hypothetical protein